MELELGLKHTRVADEFSSADFLLAKDRSGPLFISTETDTMFILTAHLKGYRKQNIKIEINEDGTQIIVSGEKTIQETVMIGWKLHKKEIEIRRFKKAFKIPDGVILDEIRANFDDDESTLTISIPKEEKGIRGFSIEEVKEQEIARQGSEALQVVPDEENVPQEKHAETEECGLSKENSPKFSEIACFKEPEETEEKFANSGETQEGEVHDMKEEKMEEMQQEHVKTDTTEETKKSPEEGNGEANPKASVVGSRGAADEAAGWKSGMQGEELEKKGISQRIEEDAELEHDQCPNSEQKIEQDQHKNDQLDAKKKGIKGDEGEESAVVEKAHPQECMASRTHEEKDRCKLCTPILAGSALLLSLVVFVIKFIRTKSQSQKRKD